MQRLKIGLSICLMQLLSCASFCLIGMQTRGQDSSRLTIDEVYGLAKKNYPLIKQYELIRKTKDYTVENASKGYLPSLSFAGQATYQSDVTGFPFKVNIPGFSLPEFSKDQYKVYGELDQVVYDGGLIHNQKETAVANEAIQEKSLEVDLYSLYDRINQLFFGVLLMDEQLKQNALLKKDIQNGIDKTKAQVENGTAYRSSVNELEAQLLQADQTRVEQEATRKAYLEMLGLFINHPFDQNISLERPPAPNLEDSINRPELMLYEFQKKSYDLQDQLLNIQLRPRLNFFVQGGYARPGLNFLSNDFAFYYIGGLRMSWNLGSLYSLKNQRQILDLNRKSLDVQKETFLFNTKLTQKQENTDITKYQDLIKTDDQIIQLRESVKNSASAQLDNGVLSAHDYLSQVNAEDIARRLMILHQMELLQAQYNYQYITGNH
jgi:outer membrane protein TolC